MPSAFLIFLMFLLMLVFGFGNQHILHDPDTAWHLATGNLIRATGNIPKHDDWSFNTLFDVWYNLSWLFDLALSYLFDFGGLPAIYFFTVLIFASQVILMTDNCLKRGASFSSILIIILPVASIISLGLLARPNMLSALFTILFYLILTNARDFNKPRLLAILPILMALWVNLHGGFLLAFPIMGFFLIEAWWEKRNVTIYLLLIAFCLLATLLNPYGYSIYYGAYRTISADFSKYLNEWKPVDIGHNIPMASLIFLMLCFGNINDKKVKIVDRFLAISMTMLSLTSVRHAVIASLLLMPYLSLRITEVVTHSRFAAIFGKIDVVLANDMQKKDIKILALIMLIAVCGLLSFPNPRDELLKEPIGFEKKNFPIKEAEFIAKNYPNLRFFNHYNIGGYLVYLWQGKVKVFVDGRANSLYSDDLLRDYQEFVEARGYGHLAELIALQYRIDGLIIPNSLEDTGLWNSNPAWKVVYRGEAATVYLKRK
ncbi:MAG: hypothetical protein WCJ33_06895 [Pseudomonadota bacterium]